MANNNKHTGPNVPALRFPEFSGEWESRTIGDDCKILMCKRIFANQTTPEGEVPFYKIGTIGDKADAYISKKLFEEYKQRYNYPKCGEVMITCAGTVGKTILYNGQDAYYQDSNIVWISNPRKIYSNEFLNYLLNRVDWSKLNSTTITRIYNDNLRELHITFPSREEQDKIVSLLTRIDDRIDTQSKIIKELTALRSALHQGIMSTGLEDGSWRMQTLAEVLYERTELNNEGHAVHSVSVSKGIVNQIEYLGRSFAAKDTSRYHVAYPGDVIYTKSPTGEFPYGIVKQSQISIKAALSPLYGVYVPISPEIGYIIHNHFLSSKNALNYLHPLIQKGAKNTINITNQRFLKNSMPLPTNKNAALLYYNAIKTVSDKIILEEMVMEKIQSQKSFLLKTMFI